MAELSFVGQLLNPLVAFVLKITGEQHELRADIEDDIDFIQKELRTIAFAIEQHPIVPPGREEWCILEEWRELAYEMEQSIGLFIHEHARERQQNPFSLEDGNGPLIDPTSLARSLKNLRKKLEESEKRAKRYGLCSAGPPSTSVTTREPEEPSFRAGGDTVGMCPPLGDILELIHPSSDPREEKLRVISIVGPGGVGKTLLVRRAYDNVLQAAMVDEDDLMEGIKSLGVQDDAATFNKHKHKHKRLLESHIGGKRLIQVGPLFHLFAWVRAADMADEDVLREILRGIGRQDDTATFKKHELIELLRSHLCRERYLIVIDDIRKKQLWEDIKPAFPDIPQVSSRVIVTTTIQSVADACSSGNGHVYKMRTLNEDNSRELFTRKSCLREHEHPHVVAQNSAGLVRKCDGLPLALVSTAQFLQEKGGLDSCAGICRDLGILLEKEPTLERMQWVLASKYNSLSPALKSRLQYFSTLNCFYPIKRDSIIRRWIAEGFIENEHRRSCNLMIQLKESWNTLIDQNIIQPTEVSVRRINEGVKRCRASGMVLEYISNKSMVEKFVAFADQTPKATYIRRFSMHDGRDDFENFGSSYPRTLVVSGQAGKSVLTFANCELMRVLDLEHCTDLENRHLEKICNLLLLKFLSLGPSITEIPRNIKNLEWLETLDLPRNGIKFVPKEVILLPKLTHLLGRFQLIEGNYNIFSKSDLEGFLSEEGNLETLTGFVAGRNRGFPQLLDSMTRRLRKLKIWCDSEADEKNLDDLSYGITKFIGKGTEIPGLDSSLSIDFEDFKDSHPFQKFLASLSKAKGSVASLKLRGPAKQLSQILTLGINLRGLTQLCLSSTTTLTWNDIVVVGLSNSELRCMQLVADEIQGDFVIKREQFIALKQMCLVMEKPLPQITIEAGALKYLVSLHLICRRLDCLSGIEITWLTGLKEVELHPETATYTVNAWKDAARCHPNRPRILIPEDPNHAEEIGATPPSNAHTSQHNC